MRRRTLKPAITKQESDQFRPGNIQWRCTQRLEIRQSHALVMTPQLMQAIKLLQLSNLDLAAYVEGELERNPLLERVGEGQAAGRGRGGDAPASEPPTARAGAPIGPATAVETQPQRHASATGADLENVPPDDADAASARRRRGAAAGYSEWARHRQRRRDDGDYNLEAFVSAETTLADHLAEQLALAVADPARPHDRAVPHRSGRRGRLSQRRSGDGRREARRAARPRSRPCSRSCRGFDPPGVCARNLTECLAIQLKERDRFDPAMQALVGHLDLLAKRDLARACAGSAASARRIWPT